MSNTNKNDNTSRTVGLDLFRDSLGIRAGTTNGEFIVITKRYGYDTYYVSHHTGTHNLAGARVFKVLEDASVVAERYGGRVEEVYKEINPPLGGQSEPCGEGRVRKTLRLKPLILVRNSSRLTTD